MPKIRIFQLHNPWKLFKNGKIFRMDSKLDGFLYQNIYGLFQLTVEKVIYFDVELLPNEFYFAVFDVW